MTGVITSQLSGLAGTLAGLRERVRAAVAGELGRAVGDAVRQVVQAAVAHRADPPCPCASAPRWDDDDADDHDPWGRPRHPWGDRGDEGDGLPPRTRTRPEPPSDGPPGAGAGVPAAVAAGVFAARWWLLRRGTSLAAAGLGLGVGLLGVLGGPLARTAVAVLAAAAEVLSAADALGGGAARLEHL